MGPKTKALKEAYEAAQAGGPERPLWVAAVAAGMSPNNTDARRWAYGKLARSGWQPGR